MSFAGRIIVLNKYLTKGKDVRNYEQDLAVLVKENNLLAGKIADASGLARIEQEALKLGFIVPTLTSFLTPPTAASAITPDANRF